MPRIWLLRQHLLPWSIGLRGITAWQAEVRAEKLPHTYSLTQIYTSYYRTEFDLILFTNTYRCCVYLGVLWTCFSCWLAISAVLLYLFMLCVHNYKQQRINSLGKNKTVSSFGKDSIVLVGKRAGYCGTFLVELSVYLPTTLTAGWSCDL